MEEHKDVMEDIFDTAPVQQDTAAPSANLQSLYDTQV